MSDRKWCTRIFPILLILLVVFLFSCSSSQRKASSEAGQDDSSRSRLYLPTKAAKSTTPYRNAVVPSMPAKHGRLVFYTAEKFPGPLSVIVMGQNGVMLTLNGQDAFVVDLPAGWFTVEKKIMDSKFQGRTMSYKTVFTLDDDLGFSLFEGETKYLRLIRVSEAKWIVQFTAEGAVPQDFQDIVYSGYYVIDN